MKDSASPRFKVGQKVDVLRGGVSITNTTVTAWGLGTDPESPDRDQIWYEVDGCAHVVYEWQIEPA